jgi:hypothetical protein
MITTIDEYISMLKHLKSTHGGSTPILVFDRILTDDQADSLSDCKFDAVHTTIEETIANA